jgi:RNA polymerase sigma factor (TIGR02999 family)
MNGQTSQFTEVLSDVRGGSAGARERLFSLVYEELRRVAGGLMRRERPDHTLQPTALVNESLLRLLDGDTLENVRDRAYFFAAAAQAMRRVLVDHARAKYAAKRGGEAEKLPLDEAVALFEQQNMSVLDLDEALEELRALDERQYQVVMLRYFGGLAVPEVAAQLDVSVGTVENDFRIARAWLRARIDRN